MTFPSRTYWSVDDRVGIAWAALKARDVARLVGRGDLDLGFTGIDMVEESSVAEEVDFDAVEEVVDLQSSKSVGLPVRWTLAVPKDSNVVSVDDLLKATGGRPPRIAAELATLVSAWAGLRIGRCEVIRTAGSTEAFAPAFADAVVDLVETGESLRRNNLVELETVMHSTVRLWASTAQRHRAEVAAVRSHLESTCREGLAALGISGLSTGQETPLWRRP